MEGASPNVHIHEGLIKQEKGPSAAPSSESTVMRTDMILKNFMSNRTEMDQFHGKIDTTAPCNELYCKGAIMFPGKPSKPSSYKPKDVLLREAEQFYKEYFASVKGLGSAEYEKRWNEVKSSIEAHNTYWQTENELHYGVKHAWRNAARCIGRIQWSKRLQVFDCRKVTTAKDMFEAICGHIRYATNNGNMRSSITVFAQREDKKIDFRVWNSQLVGFAGYKLPNGEYLGDPINAELTEICIRLGWESKQTRFDVLPIVLQANSEEPEYFDIPEDLVLLINIEHPKFKWFKSLGYKWYALPAVANMLLDCGGIEYPACPFSGWYMGTEVGTRDLCDRQRYNVLPEVCDLMFQEKKRSAILWKDKALVEINEAVLYSYKKANVTIVDHHTTSESFMIHLRNEQKLRGGCPADWVWIVPPISGGITPVFHQEMLCYYIKPSFEYQEKPWKIRQVSDSVDGILDAKKKSTKKSLQPYWTVIKLASTMYSKALAKRIKVTILYATETGKSERFAYELRDLFMHAFNVKVINMEEFDIRFLSYETLVIFVTSTFGNGDPPENGEAFAHNIKMMQSTQDVPEVVVKKPRHAAFVRQATRSFSRQVSVMSTRSAEQLMTDDEHKLLSNVRYAVFGLGSSAYPNYCAFAKYVNDTMEDLGATSIYEFTPSDEMCGQEQTFQAWSIDVFKSACTEFSLTEDEVDHHIKPKESSKWNPDNFKLIPCSEDSLLDGLSNIIKRRLCSVKIIGRIELHRTEQWYKTVKVTVNSEDNPNLMYQPGDHLGVCPENEIALVEGILDKVDMDPDKVMKLHSVQDSPHIFEPVKWPPASSLRRALSNYLDINSVLKPQVLKHLSLMTTDPNEKKSLELLSESTKEYENWKTFHYPNVLEVLNLFPSVKVTPEFLLTNLPELQPRFYSISSCGFKQIDLTVAVVSYQTQDNGGPIHYGVCSNYLDRLAMDDELVCFVRPANNFHMPEDYEKPIVMIGPGSGIAPFRGFWKQREEDKIQFPERQFGDLSLLVGSRAPDFELYTQEIAEMEENDVLQTVLHAFSRVPQKPKVYVQDLIELHVSFIYKQLVKNQGHLFICGDIQMSEDVQKVLETLLIKCGAKPGVIEFLQSEGRLHEDIFGLTLRTAEVTTRLRQKLLF